MHLNELSRGQSVVLEIVKLDAHSEVHGSVMVLKNNIIVLEPIIIDDKVLVLNDPDIHVNLVVAIDENKPLLWKNIAFGMTVVKNHHCIVLKSNNVGVVYNRRGSYRLSMDNAGYLRNEKIIIHDISSTGLSFYTNKEKRKTIGSEIDIRFTTNYEEIHVKGRIVREIEAGDRYLYGCTIHANPAVESYIAFEQRKRVMMDRKKR